jgi:uncharacterized protein YbaR (Trm112 family)
MHARLDVFQCPYCRGALTLEASIHCVACGHAFPIENGIPRLYAPDDPESSDEKLTERVRTFYEETPFPNYEDFESIQDLVNKAEKGLFARMLNDQIPFNSMTLEVGCGTGQLTNYLGIGRRTMFGVDMTLNSLELANEFRLKNELRNVGFYQMNLYRPIFRDERSTTMSPMARVSTNWCPARANSTTSSSTV